MEIKGYFVKFLIIFRKRSNGEMHFRAQRHAYNVTGRTISSFLDMVAFVKTDR